MFLQLRNKKYYKIFYKNYLFNFDFFPPWNKKDKIIIIATGEKNYCKEVIERILCFSKNENTFLFSFEDFQLDMKIEKILPFYGSEFKMKDWDILLFVTDDENKKEHKNCLYYFSKNFNFKKAYLIEKNYYLLDITRHFKFKVENEEILTFAYVEPQTWYYLYNLSKKINENGTTLEIGTYIGGTTIALAKGKKGKGKVVTIDPVLPECFYENISKNKLSEKIIPFEMHSFDFFKIWKEKCNDLKINENIGILFLDGCHNYEDVLKDLRDWNNYLTEGSILIIHDYYHPIQQGISMATYKFFNENNGFELIKKFEDCIICKKIK